MDYMGIDKTIRSNKVSFGEKNYKDDNDKVEP